MKETKTKIYYSIGSRASGKTQSIIERLKEENESLHHAFNEQYKQNEELIKINNQLGKEKEQLSNDIKLYQSMVDDLKLEKFLLKHAVVEKNEIIFDCECELDQYKEILKILQRFNFTLYESGDYRSIYVEQYRNFYSDEHIEVVNIQITKEEYEFLKKYEGK